MVTNSVRARTKPFPTRQIYGGIAALSPIFDVAFYCGRYIKITNTGGGLNNFRGGNEILVTVADTCDDCAEADLGKSLNSLFKADLQLLRIATGLDASSMSLLLDNRTIEHQYPAATEFSIQW